MSTSTIKKTTLAAALLTLSAASMEADANSVWEVKKGEDTLYIGGTIHMLPISEFPLPKAFTDTYQKADSIVLETKLPEKSDMEAQQYIMKKMSYSGDNNLSKNLKPETIEKLTNRLNTYGLKVDDINQFKPGFVGSFFSMMEAQRHNLAGEGVDTYFSQLAKKDSKPMEYLETLDFQISMISNQGVGNEDAFINLSLKDLDQFKPMMTSLISAWREGDVTFIEDSVNDKLKEKMPKFYEELFPERNNNWVPKIENMFGDADTEFVLVGVGHLAGDDNVISLLENKGYQVTKL